MELKNVKYNEPENDILKEYKTINDVFKRTIVIDNITFKLKDLRGKDFFKLVNKFSFSNFTDVSEISMENFKESNAFSKLSEIFEDSFDIGMESLLFSLNGKDFKPLVINGIYQIENIDTNFSMLYKILFFIYESCLLFMSFS